MLDFGINSFKVNTIINRYSDKIEITFILFMLIFLEYVYVTD